MNFFFLLMEILQFMSVITVDWLRNIFVEMGTVIEYYFPSTKENWKKGNI